MTILIADDDPVVRHILSAILGQTDSSIESVESGQGCLDFVAERAEKNEMPQVIFLDIQLQDMPGTEVLKKLRGAWGASAPKVIALSGNTREEVEAIDPEFSPDYFLEKPFEPARVLETLTEIERGMG
jgi:CheY-like chemotaxis protein